MCLAYKVYSYGGDVAVCEGIILEEKEEGDGESAWRKVFKIPEDYECTCSHNTH